MQAENWGKRDDPLPAARTVTRPSGPGHSEPTLRGAPLNLRADAAMPSHNWARGCGHPGTGSATSLGFARRGSCGFLLGTADARMNEPAASGA